MYAITDGAVVVIDQLHNCCKWPLSVSEATGVVSVCMPCISTIRCCPPWAS